MKKNISIEPCAGLGNRIRVLASAKKLSDYYQWNLNIIWKQEAACYAKFSSLFKDDNTALNIVEVTEMPFRMKPLQTLTGTLKKRKYLHGANFISTEDVADLCHTVNEKDEINYYPALISKIMNEDNCYIKSTGELCQCNTEDFQFLQPSDKVQSRGASIWNMITDQTIGVHVRRTDQEASIKYSTLSAFERMMDAEIQKNPHVSFYLASDDEQVLESMERKYGERLLDFRGRDARRDVEEGIIDALIEMYALSKCTKIIGSYYSSYSKIAALMGGIECEIALENDV